MLCQIASQRFRAKEKGGVSVYVHLVYRPIDCHTVLSQLMMNEHRCLYVLQKVIEVRCWPPAPSRSAAEAGSARAASDSQPFPARLSGLQRSLDKNDEV